METNKSRDEIDAFDVVSLCCVAVCLSLSGSSVRLNLLDNKRSRTNDKHS